MSTRTTGRRRARAFRAAIRRQAADLAPAITDELQRQALTAITDWCTRPRRSRADLACLLLAVTGQAVSLNRMLDASIRACILSHRDGQP